MSRYHVFVDESEFAADELVMLGALLVPEDVLPKLERDLTKLRETIGRKMRREKYTAYVGSDADLKRQRCRPEAARLRAGGLPEIHAKEMWNSSGSYHCKRTPDLIPRRNEWLFRVARILNKYPVLFVTRSFQGKFRSFDNSAEKELIAVLEEVITPDISRKDVDDLIHDIHFAITFELFIYLDSLNEVGVDICSVTCDKGKRTELFGKFEGFERAREYGYWQNFPNPKFEDSHESAGVQLADFLTYFTGKIFYAEDTTAIEWEVYSRIGQKHQRFITSSGEAATNAAVTPPRRIAALMTAMQIEAILLHCGGLATSRPQRRETAEQLTRQLFSRYSAAQMVEAPITSYRGPVQPENSASLDSFQEDN